MYSQLIYSKKIIFRIFLISLFTSLMDDFFKILGLSYFSSGFFVKSSSACYDSPFWSSRNIWRLRDGEPAKITSIKAELNESLHKIGFKTKNVVWRETYSILENSSTHHLTCPCDDKVQYPKTSKRGRVHVCMYACMRVCLCVRAPSHFLAWWCWRPHLEPCESSPLWHFYSAPAPERSRLIARQVTLRVNKAGRPLPKWHASEPWPKLTFVLLSSLAPRSNNTATTSSWPSLAAMCNAV